MKKVILSLVVLSLVACHSSSVEVKVDEDSVLAKFKVDTVKVDSVKVIDSLKK